MASMLFCVIILHLTAGINAINALNLVFTPAEWNDLLIWPQNVKVLFLSTLSLIKC